MSKYEDLCRFSVGNKVRHKLLGYRGEVGRIGRLDPQMLEFLVFFTYEFQPGIRETMQVWEGNLEHVPEIECPF